MSSFALFKRNLLHLHVRHRKEEEKKFKKKYPSRRWMVERTNSWHKIQDIIYQIWTEGRETILVLYNWLTA